MKRVGCDVSLCNVHTGLAFLLFHTSVIIYGVHSQFPQFKA